MRGRAENFVKDGIMQSTLREMQAFLRLRNLWITLAAGGLLFTVTGPFGDDADLIQRQPALADEHARLVDRSP